MSAGIFRPRAGEDFEDFGTQGDRPTHPELLDWLASEFIDSGWSLKHMHRLIVTSATYKQSSNTRPELENRDPGNTLLARQSRLRLPAELIRDEALSTRGLTRSIHWGTEYSPAVDRKEHPKSATAATIGRRARAKIATAAVCISIFSAPHPIPCWLISMRQKAQRRLAAGCGPIRRYRR